ncbi:MAG: oligosaccharide flippase family protein [Pirellula sp.]|jgi:O-antigen/teichoic acid export membrane protein
MSSIAVARVIGKEDFGTYGFILTTIATTALIGGQGLSVAATKRVAEFKSTNKEQAGNAIALSIFVSIALSLLMALLLFTASVFFSRFLGINDRLAFYLKCSAPLVLTGTVSQVLLGLLYGLEEFKIASFGQILVSVMRLFFVVGGALGFGLSGCILGLVCAESVFVLAQLGSLYGSTKRQSIKIRLGGFGNERTHLLQFALPTYISSLLLGPTNWICQATLIAGKHGVADLAVFNACWQWRTAICFLPQKLQGVGLPKLCQYRAKNDVKKFYRFFLQNSFLAIASSIVVVLPLFFLATPILQLYGNDFSDEVSIFYVTLVTAVLQVAARSQMQAIHAGGGGQFDLISSIIRSATQLGCWYFLSYLGALGLSISILISYALLNCFTWFFLYLDAHRWSRKIGVLQ